jgi:hypothetical protein
MQRLGKKTIFQGSQMIAYPDLLRGYNMKRRTIHEWKNWILEYINDDKYELSQKDNLSVQMIVAKNAMDAENQCQQIIKNTKKEGD